MNRFLVENGFAPSRRKADKIISEGRIFVNGKKAFLGQEVSENDSVLPTGGVPIKPKKGKFSYGAFYKPKEYVCSHSGGGKSVFKLLPHGILWKWAGRLDQDSEGLLLISDDGDFIHRASHPSFGCEKEYEVSTQRPLSRSEIDACLEGILVDGKLMKFEKVKQYRKFLTITLKTGFKRQIRRMLGYFSADVVNLKRTRHGVVVLGKLPMGGFRELQESEINYFKSLTKNKI